MNKIIDNHVVENLACVIKKLGFHYENDGNIVYVTNEIDAGNNATVKIVLPGKTSDTHILFHSWLDLSEDIDDKTAKEIEEFVYNYNLTVHCGCAGFLEFDRKKNHLIIHRSYSIKYFRNIDSVFTAITEAFDFFQGDFGANLDAILYKSINFSEIFANCFSEDIVVKN